MTERNEIYSREAIVRGSMPDDQWQYMSELALRYGAEIERPAELEPAVLVGLKDFRALSIQKYDKDDQGCRAYASLMRVARDQAGTHFWTINAELPSLVFRQMPADAKDYHYWVPIKEQFDDLELTSLRNYVYVVETMEARAITPSAQEKLYSRLGKRIGPGTVQFWREIVDEHENDPRSW